MINGRPRKRTQIHPALHTASLRFDQVTATYNWLVGKRNQAPRGLISASQHPSVLSLELLRRQNLTSRRTRVRAQLQWVTASPRLRHGMPGKQCPCVLQNTGLGVSPVPSWMHLVTSPRLSSPTCKMGLAIRPCRRGPLPAKLLGCSSGTAGHCRYGRIAPSTRGSLPSRL